MRHEAESAPLHGCTKSTTPLTCVAGVKTWQVWQAATSPATLGCGVSCARHRRAGTRGTRRTPRGAGVVGPRRARRLVEVTPHRARRAARVVAAAEREAHLRRRGDRCGRARSPCAGTTWQSLQSAGSTDAIGERGIEVPLVRADAARRRVRPAVEIDGRVRVPVRSVARRARRNRDVDLPVHVRLVLRVGERVRVTRLARLRRGRQARPPRVIRRRRLMAAVAVELRRACRPRGRDRAVAIRVRALLRLRVEARRAAIGHEGRRRVVRREIAESNQRRFVAARVLLNRVDGLDGNGVTRGAVGNVGEVGAGVGPRRAERSMAGRTCDGRNRRAALRIAMATGAGAAHANGAPGEIIPVTLLATLQRKLIRLQPRCVKARARRIRPARRVYATRVRGTARFCATPRAPCDERQHEPEKTTHARAFVQRPFRYVQCFDLPMSAQGARTKFSSHANGAWRS